MNFLKLLYNLILGFLLKISDTNDLGSAQHLPHVELLSLTNTQFNNLTRLRDADHMNKILDRITIPRVVGSPGHTKVREFIIETMEDLKWSVETDQFEQTVPIKGKLQFTNIIATLNPDAEQFLVLACHYDSKYFPNMQFVGAIDSAVPCAMLLNTAYVLQGQLDTLRNRRFSIKFVFFDGEEAFKTWSDKDSIYGAKHLAKKWQRDGEIEKIELLMLLDLLGSPDPQFCSFYENSDVWYSKLVTIENVLSKKNLLPRYTGSGIIRHASNGYFRNRASHGNYVEDDHLPFLKLGVPILHVIPVPFPDVWHTADDDLDHVDRQTTENLSQIIRLFTMEYLLTPKK